MAQGAESFTSNSFSSDGRYDISKESEDDTPEKGPPIAHCLSGSHFSAASSQSEVQSVSVASSSTYYSKLEVVDARQISVLLRWFTAGVILGAVVSVVLIVLGQTAFKFKFSEEDYNSYFDPHYTYSFAVSVISICIFTFMLCLLFIYLLRIMRLRKSDRTHQQVWVIILLLATVLYFQPYYDILRITHFGHVINIGAQDWIGREEMGQLVQDIRLSSFSIMTLIYTWASLHSYGMFKPNLGVRFYATKSAALLGYIIFQLVIDHRYKMRTEILPFSSGISFILFAKAFYGTEPEARFGKDIPRYAPICIGLLSVYEAVLLILIVRRALLTRRVLGKVNYLRYRTKQIGFRCFLYKSINFYVVFWICYIATLVVVPRNSGLLDLLFSNRIYLDFTLNTLGLEILIATYVFHEAYLNLPADAIGLRGWFHPTVGNERAMRLVPIMYKKLEPKFDGKRPLELQPNCFVMQTHVEMFNFSWLVYYHNTPKYAGLRRTPGLFSYNIKIHVTDDDTDTHALVIDGSDRIVVAFRGTSSGRNFRTDLKAFHVLCSKVVPTKLKENDFETDESSVQKTLNSKDFLSAKFHKGFALAYMSISQRVMKAIKDLYDKRERPIYLTGHSLGGALAAIASFDLYLKMGLGPNDIFVSSFGAPRVGNSSFRRMYNERVPNHWRIVIGPDIVTRLPKVGYQHVGKKVLLTAAGELFIDPNSLEMKHWHGDPASILYHRKASYLLAMRAWCRKHHRETYEPNFWAYPFTNEDSRRFPDAMLTIRSGKVEVKYNYYKRIMTLDAMVDELDRKQQKGVSEGALSNWSRLTRRARLDEAFKRADSMSMGGSFVSNTRRSQ